MTQYKPLPQSVPAARAPNTRGLFNCRAWGPQRAARGRRKVDSAVMHQHQACNTPDEGPAWPISASPFADGDRGGGASETVGAASLNVTRREPESCRLRASLFFLGMVCLMLLRCC